MRVVTATPHHTAEFTLLQSRMHPQTKKRVTRLSIYLILFMRILPRANTIKISKRKPSIIMEFILTNLEIEIKMKDMRRYALVTAEQTRGRQRFFLVIQSFGLIQSYLAPKNSLQDVARQANIQNTPNTIPPQSIPLNLSILVIIPKPQAIKKPLIISHPYKTSNSINLFILVDMINVFLLLRSKTIPKPIKGRANMMHPILNTQNKVDWLLNCKFGPKRYLRSLRGTNKSEYFCCPSIPIHVIAVKANKSKIPLNEEGLTKAINAIAPSHNKPTQIQTRINYT